MSVDLASWCVIPTPMGHFRMYDTGTENVRVLCLGDLREQGPQPLLRIHSSCLASEVFGALDCDCADQLRESMKRIAMEGRGVIVHLHQEGRGHGLSQKIRAVHAMQDRDLDTFEAFETLGIEQDVRTYEAALGLVRRLGLSSVRLITNNPAKVRYFKEYGVQVEVVNTHPTIRAENAKYLETKNAKLGHRIPLEPDGKTSGTIHFYHSDQPWGDFSNFSRHAVFLHGRIWPTVEHFYQAQKYADTPLEERIRCCSTPLLAKQTATEFSAESRRHDWDAAKELVMLEGLRAKFNQHPDLGRKLLGTFDRLLAEHTRDDRFWGDGGDGTGQNQLGHLLMRVRSELQARIMAHNFSD